MTSAIAAFERAEGVPVLRRTGSIIGLAAASYAAIAIVVIANLLPVGFGLAGGALLIAQLLVAVAGAAAVGAIAVVVRRGIGRRARLWMLCAQRGWTYRGDIGDRPWGGSIDEQIERRARTATDHVDARADAVPFDAVRRTFTVGDGEGASVHSVLTVRIPLPSEAPRITLRSRAGGGALSALPRRRAAGDELRLEGGFSDAFEVSAPAGYEVDALYVLTPDLMAILWDTAADLDLEIVDQTLHVYLPDIDLADPDVLGRFLTMVAALHERFGRQTMRYRDEAALPLDADVSRRSGDTLSAGARRNDTRMRFGPVVAAVLTPLVPVLIAVVWSQLTG